MLIRLEQAFIEAFVAVMLGGFIALPFVAAGLYSSSALEHSTQPVKAHNAQWAWREL